jgi:hypothetical protein
VRSGQGIILLQIIYTLWSIVLINKWYSHIQGDEYIRAPLRPLTDEVVIMSLTMIPVCSILTPFGTKDIQCKGKVVGVRNYAYAPWRRMRSKGVAPRSLNLSTRKLLTNSLEEGAPSTHRRKGWVNPISGVDKTRYKKCFTQSGIERRDYST